MEISEIKEYAKKNSVPVMFDETNEFICSYIREHGVRSVLEIGTAIGYSAICFALSSADVRVVTVEIDIDRFIRAKENVAAFSLGDRISLNHCDALEFKTDEKFDLIFIDAAKAQYTNFFERYKRNLSPRGIILTDNLSFHGMVEDSSLTSNYSTKKLVRKIRKYVSFLKYNPEFTTEFFSTGDGIAVTKVNPDYREISFAELDSSDSDSVSEMAEYSSAIVREVYDPVLGEKQASFMAEKFQDADSVRRQMDHGSRYFFVEDGGSRIGFLSFYRREDEICLGRFFLAAENRKKGFSKNMIWFVVSAAKKSGIHSIVINVSKNNPAAESFKALGFEVTGSVRTDMGSGFFVDDFIMTLRF